MLTLARALNYKNRVVEEIKRLDSEILSNNSRLQDNDCEVNARACYLRRIDLTDHLIALKAAIAEANVPMNVVIYRLAELKGQLTFFRSLNTKHGKFSETDYDDEGRRVKTEVHYVAHLRKNEVDAANAKIRSEIDLLQSELEAFNHKTTIAIEPLL